jgi:hypothetical protein
MLACARQGHSNTCQKAQGKSERSRGKILQPVVLPALQGKGLVRQRSLKEKKSFVTFSLKSNGPLRPRAD